jgi:hypothetical protein
MDSRVVAIDSKNTLDLMALEDDVQYWVDLMPEHDEVAQLEPCSGCHHSCYPCSACGC